ncbi:MAG TPA: 3-phosphoshikimate 1-carboxyvinyltransferase [Thermoanaerobaculia bacterium]|nr:3-phosphoshikimate 1-carboxyvinyltransferase [Thermoanaerobaculia bacterium]
MVELRPRPIPAGRVARGRVTPPPSKSVTHRYLNLTLLSGREAAIRRPLLAEDTRLFLDALAALGWGVEASEDAARLIPPAAPSRAAPLEAELACGNAGTLFRFLTASLAVSPGRWRLDGSPRLRERPVGPLVAALRELGARIEPAAAGASPGHAPLIVHGGPLPGGRATLDAGRSSQYLSALLMACLRAESTVELAVPALTSHPYVELTRAAIRRFTPSGSADPIEGLHGGYRIRPARPVPPPDLIVEGDYSAACYPAAAAALTGGRVTLAGLSPTSAQGDRRFLDLLSRMGARVAWRAGELEVEGRELAALEVDLSAMPDQVPTLAALAPFAKGSTRIYNVSHLRIKESDRLRALASGLGRLGVPVEELRDGLRIPGCWAGGAPTVPAGSPAGELVTLDPAGDHRIAMAFALVGLRREGVAVANPEVVAKSYPGFWRDLDALLAAG